MDMMKRSQHWNEVCLNSILSKIQPDASQPKWVQCPTCKQEWNKLGETGVCLDCERKCNDC